jgi:hypothetical protein
MKASEVKLQSLVSGGFTTMAPNSHYKFLMELGRVFPSNKSQANFFVAKGVCLEPTGMKGVEAIENLLNKHGMEGEYQFTKSKQWVRLLNNSDLHRALILEYK